MSSKAELNVRLDDMAIKLEETRDAAVWTSGPAQDAIKVVIPMMQDMLEVIRDVLKFASSSPE